MSKKITGMAEVPALKKCWPGLGVTKEEQRYHTERHLLSIRHNLMGWAYFKDTDEKSKQEAKRRLRVLAARWKKVFSGAVLKVTLSKPPPRRHLELIRSEAMHRAIKDGFRPPRRDVKNTKYDIVYDSDGRVDSVKVSVLNGTRTLVTYLASVTDDRLVLRKHMSLDD